MDDTYGTIGVRRGLNGDIEALGATSGLTGIEPVSGGPFGDAAADQAKTQRLLELKARRDYQAQEAQAEADARAAAAAKTRAIQEEARFARAQAAEDKRAADAQERSEKEKEERERRKMMRDEIRAEIEKEREEKKKEREVDGNQCD